MRSVAIILALGLLAQQATAGRLDDFEKKTGKKKSDSSSSSPSTQSRSSGDATTSSFGSGTYPSSGGDESFLGGFLTWLVAAPFQYRNDDPAASLLPETERAEADAEGWAEEDSAGFFRHSLGAPTIPYVRADYNQQYVDTNLEAEDVRIEVGYKLLAFHGRHTVYTESNPDDELILNQYYGVLRLGGTLHNPDYPNGSWEVGLGLGAVQMQGNTEHSSGAMTIPIKLYPTDWIGLEFRPAWYRPQERVISDYDVSASLGWRYVQGRVGYRWLWIQGVGHELNGPYAGVSVSF